MGITLMIVGATMLVAKILAPGYVEVFIIGVGLVVYLIGRK